MEEIIGYLLIPCIPFIVFGNFLVLLSIYNDKALRERAYCLIGCLAIADFLAGCVSAPCMVYAYMCYFPATDPGGWKDIALWYLPDVVSTVCLLHTLLLTTERLIAVKWPLQSRIWLTTSTLRYISLAVWVVQLAWWAIPFLAFPFDMRLKKEPRYIMLSIALCYLLPLLLIIFEWLIILHTIRQWKSRRLRQQSFMNSLGTLVRSATTSDSLKDSNTASKEDQKLLKTVSYVSVMLILGYVPNSIWWSMSLFTEDTFPMQLFSVLSNVLQVSNCIVNPIIYAAKVKRFRVEFIRVLHLKCGFSVVNSDSSTQPSSLDQVGGQPTTRRNIVSL